MRGFEWQHDFKWFNQGWFRAFGYGLAWEWDQPPRFSDRMRVRRSLLIGRLRIRPLGPRGMIPKPTAAGEAKS